MVNTHKFLGVMLGQELRWMEHINYALHKGTKWVTQYCRLARPSKGVSAKFMRQFYVSVAVPRMLYVTNLFLVPESKKNKGTKCFINKLGDVQRHPALHITGVMRLAPTDTIGACTNLLPFHLLIEKLVH